jgi:hypothetical protein
LTPYEIRVEITAEVAFGENISIVWWQWVLPRPVPKCNQFLPIHIVKTFISP